VSQICFNLIKRNIPVKLFTTQKKDLNSINDVVNTITKQIADSGRSLLSTVHSTTVDELMQNINSCEIIVATRFHATVLPMQLGIPVFGICYYRKSSELLDDVGLGDFHVDIDDISVELVTEKILELKDNSTYYSRIMTNAFNEYSNQLDSQYKKLIELIE
jgi:polysaccharide pyruvyl transferase WcaK-like protein